MVKEILEGMNGKIEVISEPGQGSSFKIILPLNQSKKFKPVSANIREKQPASNSA
jgi:hypothetical protein